MLSVNELHIDFLRLLDSTERLVADGESSADGSWENWSRFCQFISSLDGLQSQLLARLSETNALSATTVGSPRFNRTLHPSAEDIDRYDRRLETLRRKREDLSSAAAAAEEEEQAKAAVTSIDDTSPDADVAPTAPEVRVTFATSESLPEEQEFNRTKGGGAYGVTSQEQSQRRDAGRGLFRPRSSSKGVLSRRREWGGVRGDRFRETNGDEAEADQVAEEISSMAGRLKESSIAINKTLRAQTQVLEDTGDAATSNVDRVRRETERVSERLRKKRVAMCASWCMMVMVVATFLATYVLVILPFDKRRGPFVRPRHKSFADAAKQSPNISTQELQRFASQNPTRREQAIIESIVEYRERSGRSLAKKTEETGPDEGERSRDEREEEVLQSPEDESTSQDAFDSTRTAEKPEPKQDNIVLESGADSVGQASPPQAKAPEVEGAREPVCADPEGAKSCAAVEEGLIMAEPNEAGAEDNEETIEGNQQAVEAAEPMKRSKSRVGGQMEEEKINMEAFEEREEEGMLMNQLPIAEHPQEIAKEREVGLQSDAETTKSSDEADAQEEDGVERPPRVGSLLSGEGAEDDIVQDEKHPQTRPQSRAQHQYAEKKPAEESADSAFSASEKRNVDTAGSFPLEDRGVFEDSGSDTGKDNSLEAVRRRLRESLGKRREGGNIGQGGRPDEL